MNLVGHVATASIDIEAPPADVWDALVMPERVEKYMFGTLMSTDWSVGSPITWTGEWEGKEYEDKGEVLEYEEGERLSYSHYSPLTGQPDVPENYHRVIIELTPSDSGTNVTLTQDNNDTESAREHSEDNWKGMLQGLKQHVESSH